MAHRHPLWPHLQHAGLTVVARPALAELYELLDHRFDRPGLLEEALTHPSVDSKRAGTRSYQRLEFLGDRVLGLVVSNYLLRQHPDASEGDLAVRLNALVRREAVADVARQIGLSRFIRLGRSEARQGGEEKPAILADVCEAVIGALFLDGGLEPATAFVEKNWRSIIDASDQVQKDPKTRLQEAVQPSTQAPPQYEVVGRCGPDHAPMFTVEVMVCGQKPARGQGKSRREAEQAAAQAMLRTLAAD